jgi:hypothetical protein
LRNISEQTGGRASIYQRVDKELERLNETTRVEYLLAYYPKDENWNGKYRHIEVKVNRPGLKVSFRHGYYARDSIPVFDVTELLSYRRITSAGGYTRDIEDLPFQVKIEMVNDPLLAPQIRVDLRVDPEDVDLTNINGLYRGELRATIFYADNSGHYLGGVWKAVTLNLQEENFPKYQQDGIQFSILIPVQTTKQILKVILYDPEADRLGSRLIRLGQNGSGQRLPTPDKRLQTSIDSCCDPRVLASLRFQIRHGLNNPMNVELRTKNSEPQKRRTRFEIRHSLFDISDRDRQGTRLG